MAAIAKHPDWDRLAGEGFKSQRSNKLTGGLCHDNLDVGAFFDQYEFTPNKGSDVVDFWAGSSLFDYFFGPAAAELGTGSGPLTTRWES